MKFTDYKSPEKEIIKEKFNTIPYMDVWVSNVIEGYIYKKVSNVDAYAETGGLEENKYPLIGIENAVLAAIEAGIDKQTVINIVNQTYGGSTEDGNYTSSEEFDYMDNDQLDAAGLTGNKNLGPNK